jgi:hypothetical protein
VLDAETPHLPARAIASHPAWFPSLDSGIDIPAPAVLLHEGVERGQQLGHDSLPLRPMRVNRVGEGHRLLNHLIRPLQK